MHRVTLRCVRRFSSEVTVLGKSYYRDEFTNISPSIIEKAERKLLHIPNHPLRNIKQAIFSHFQKESQKLHGRPIYQTFDDVSPVVTTQQNFDSLLIPSNHPSRARTDNYYINKSTMLRAHTSAHQSEFLAQKLEGFLVAGDVYRRDEIDKSHYPVFHQMEGVRLFHHHELPFGAFDSAQPILRTDNHQQSLSLEVTKFIENHLKTSLAGMIKTLFGDVEMRWIDTYFPFTHPSWELEIYFQDEWLEVLGCGVIEQNIIKNAGVSGMSGWAFGLGLERLAMVLFGIPDIRLFWSTDERFLNQFTDNDIKTQFTPFSKYPPTSRDLTFWINDDFSLHSFSEIIRDIAGDLVERVQLVDQFKNKEGRESHSYRITFRSHERTLSGTEINDIQSKIRTQISQELNVQLR